MTDVNVHHTERPERRSPDWIWVVVALVVVALIAWFLIGRDGTERADRTLDIDIEVPTVPAPAPSGGTGTGGTGTGGQPPN